jgi:hypothetical protein
VVSRQVVPLGTDGILRLDYAVPSDWDTQADRLNVETACPSGAATSKSVRLGAPAPVKSSPGIVVSKASVVDGKFSVFARITDPNRSAEECYGYAVLVPSDDPQAAAAVLAGGWAWRVPLERTPDGRFTATVEFPGWANWTKYSLLLYISNKGTASSLSKEFEMEFVEALAGPILNPPPVFSPPRTDDDPLPMAGADAVLVALVAAAAAAGGGRARRPNRRGPA